MICPREFSNVPSTLSTKHSNPMFPGAARRERPIPSPSPPFMLSAIRLRGRGCGGRVNARGDGCTTHHPFLFRVPRLSLFASRRAVAIDPPSRRDLRCPFDNRPAPDSDSELRVVVMFLPSIPYTPSLPSRLSLSHSQHPFLFFFFFFGVPLSSAVCLYVSLCRFFR